MTRIRWPLYNVGKARGKIENPAGAGFGCVNAAPKIHSGKDLFPIGDMHRRGLCTCLNRILRRDGSLQSCRLESDPVQTDDRPRPVRDSVPARIRQRRARLRFQLLWMVSIEKKRRMPRMLMPAKNMRLMGASKISSKSPLN